MIFVVCQYSGATPGTIYPHFVLKGLKPLSYDHCMLVYSPSFFYPKDLGETPVKYGDDHSGGKIGKI